MFLPKYHLKNLIVLNKEQITFYLIFNRSLHSVVNACHQCENKDGGGR